MIYEMRRETKVVTLLDDETITVPAENTITETTADFDLSNWDSAVILVSLGTESATAVFNAKLEIKDSNGNYIDHPSGAITQMDAAGEQAFAIAKIYGETGRLSYTLTDAENDAFAHACLEIVLKS